MTHEIIYVSFEDLIYPVKLIVDQNIVSKLPITRVAEVLERFGFTSADIGDVNTRSSSRHTGIDCLRLTRDSIRCQVTEAEVVFSEAIADDQIERIKAEMHALLVTRVEILSNAAEQNSSSALINLLQNQRRACVSDMYYALHNAIAAIQEYYLFRGELDQARIPEELSRDTVEQESRLGHCSPFVAEPIINTDHLKLLWETDLEDILTNSNLRANRDARDREPHRNPFVWFAFMLREILESDSVPEAKAAHQQEAEELAGQIHHKLTHLELESLGIGGKNNNIEIGFKQLHRDVLAMLSDLEGRTRFSWLRSDYELVTKKRNQVCRD
jgi:hypothetical protein